MNPRIKRPVAPPLAPPPPPPKPRQQQAAPELMSVGRGFALRLFLVYLFLIFSRVLEFVLVGYHIPALMFLMAIPAAVMCGALSKVRLSGPMRWLLVFTLWFLVCIPFSVWRGGSVQQARILLMAVASMVPIIGLPAEMRDLRKIFFAIAAAVSLFAVVALWNGELEGGRLAVDAPSTFGNTNDMAQIILLGLPFQIFLIYELRRNHVVAGLLTLIFIPIAVALLKTGSRSLIVAAAVMFGMVFVRGSVTLKIRMVGAAAVLLIVGIVFVPRPVLLRFVTFFDVAKTEGLSQREYEAQVSAVASTVSRQELLKDSIEYTIKHPLFGVGPGMFSVARGRDREKQNQTGAWKVSHNAYTQISSECGIPALIFYVAMIGSTFLALRRAVRYQMGWNYPVSATIRAAGFTLQMAMVSYVIFAFFLSIAYQTQILIVVALAIALERLSAEEAKKLRAGKTRAPR